jgi:hypothetical protein
MAILQLIIYPLPSPPSKEKEKEKNRATPRLNIEKDKITHPAALFRAREAVLTTSPLGRTTWSINSIRTRLSQK